MDVVTGLPCCLCLKLSKARSMDFDSQVVGGLEFLKLIERVATDDKDRPTSEAMRCERVLLRWGGYPRPHCHTVAHSQVKIIETSVFVDPYAEVDAMPLDPEQVGGPEGSALSPTVAHSASSCAALSLPRLRRECAMNRKGCLKPTRTVTKYVEYPC